MRHLSWMIVLCLAGCADPVPADPPVLPPAAFPAAERFVWTHFLAEQRAPPRIQYAQKLTDDDIPGLVNAYEFIVYVRRGPTTRPSETFLCRGLMLAHLIGAEHNGYLSKSDLDLDDEFRWGPAIDLCRYELDHMALSDQASVD